MCTCVCVCVLCVPWIHILLESIALHCDAIRIYFFSTKIIAVFSVFHSNENKTENKMKIPYFVEQLRSPDHGFMLKVSDTQNHAQHTVI